MVLDTDNGTPIPGIVVRRDETGGRRVRVDGAGRALGGVSDPRLGLAYGRRAPASVS